MSDFEKRFEIIKTNKNTSNNGCNSLQKLKESVGHGNVLSVQDAVRSLAVKEIHDASILFAEKSIELVFIIDKSGSCASLESSFKKGFNDFILKEQKSEFKTLVTTVLFNNEAEVIHNRVPIKNVKNFNYVATGGTALYDTLVTQLSNIKRRQETDSSSPKHTVVVIMTDGTDRGSKKNILDDARNKIIECRKAGWEFVFLGAMIEAEEIAVDLGIKKENAVTYSGSLGVLNCFKAVELITSGVRKDGHVPSSWSEPIKKGVGKQDLTKISGNKDNKKLLLR